MVKLCILRPWNINQQDWKHTLFVVFILYSENINITMQWAGTTLLQYDII